MNQGSNREGWPIWKKKHTFGAEGAKKDTYFGHEAPKIGAKGALLENFGNLFEKSCRKMQ